MAVVADTTLGLVSMQNAVPVLRQIQITNCTSNVLNNVEVHVSCTPAFAQGARFRFESIALGETRTITPVDLKPEYEYLFQLEEAVHGSIVIRALQGDTAFAETSVPIEVLAYDQWAGTRSLPELIAAFSMPNSPVVDQIQGKASRLLRSSDASLSMDGYQSKNRSNVWKQISAIYSTLAAEELQYSEPPASFGNQGQKIRTPDRILATRVATCLDLSMLLVSCMEQAGLRPIVLFCEGHAWVGCWLIPTNFGTALIDDVQAVRKRVHAGELIVFEATGLAQQTKPSLKFACDLGVNRLEDESAFRYAIDIHRARELQIKPLPSRGRALDVAAINGGAVLPTVEAPPELPPLDPALLPIMNAGEDATTPEGRLSRWKSKLLDLSLRNRLLNFKSTKSNLQLVAPDPGAIEDGLTEGKEFKVRAQPKIMEGDDPRMALVHQARTGEKPLESLVAEAFERNELIVAVESDKLDGRLLDIYGAAQTGLQEGGANTLYMAIGMLRWTEVERAEISHFAPILMVPVTLQRQSVRSGFTLARHDDDAIINPTLLQMLREHFQMSLPKVEALSTGEKGADVKTILQAFRLAVADAKGWEVLEQVHIGIFSFTKYLMWKDLQDRTDDLRRNAVVAHLIDNPGAAFPNQDSIVHEQTLDQRYRPHDVFAPLLFDSSQLQCICVASEGHDLVIEGPPGTGKSQTITNLIAHTLANGKSVLLVSEKMAALEVVHRRLNDIGLGPFCLELHSSKAKKADVVKQLGHALDFRAVKALDDWEREANRLAALRQDLNDVVHALHRIDPNGLTVFQATSTCVKQADWKAAVLPWPDAGTHDRGELDKLRETVRQIATLAAEITNLASHPLALVAQVNWTPSWQDELLRATAVHGSSLQALDATAKPLFRLLGVPETGHSAAKYAELDVLADVLHAAPAVPAGLARHAHDGLVRSRIQSLRRHGLERGRQWDLLGGKYKESFARLDATEIEPQWGYAISTWWPKSWFAKRSIGARLSLHRVDQKRPREQEIPEALALLTRINDEDRALEVMRPDAEALLQDSFAGLNTDWNLVDRHERWAKAFSDAVLGMGGGDAAASESLRARLTPYVSNNQASLAPGGSLHAGLDAYRSAFRKLLEDADRVEKVAQCNGAFLGQTDVGGFVARSLSILSGWSLASRGLRTWCFWRGIRAKAIAQGLQGVVQALEVGETPLGTIVEYFEYSYQSWWLRKTLDRDPVLGRFASADHQRKIGEFQKVDARFQDLTRQHIVARLAGSLPASTMAAPGADSEMGRLRRELARQRGHMAVRQLIQGLPTLLPKLKPCLLMSPLSVAQYLDASHAQFDLVVFDEASQIPVWDAVGVIARGKQLVVVGDPKQLPPTNFFNRSSDEDPDDAIGDDVTDLESILDECLGAGLRKERLKWHYRSKHESLITFSNTNYYDSELITFPSPVTNDMAVRFQPVNGIYDRGGSRTNRAEADAIVAAIESHYLDPKRSSSTVGVVTFNQPQQSLITSLLDARRRANPSLDRALAEEQHEPLFIKNLENVQGDERDLIFFSITYGMDAAGRVSMTFGPLNLEGGQRRLNVAISRAREGVTIFSSLRPEQIDLSRVRAAGVRDLKNYLEFAIRGPRALVEQSLPSGREPDSPFEEVVIAKLRERGWTVHPQVGCSGYRVDIGVVDPRAPGHYLLGIECDGRSYHSGASARDRDRLRQNILEKLGWRMHRIWSTDWWVDAHGQMEKLQMHLDRLLVDEKDVAVNPVVDDVATSMDSFAVPAQPLPVSATSLNEATSENGPPVYPSAQLEQHEKSTFYSPTASSTLREQLLQIVALEGPVAAMSLFRKVARAWDMDRTGPRIVERLAFLIKSDVTKTKDSGATYYWPPSVDPKSWTGFRIAGQDDSSQRNVADVCAEELGNLVAHVLKNNGASGETELARSVCRLLGMLRTTADAEARVLSVVKRMASDGRVIAENDRIRIG